MWETEYGIYTLHKYLQSNGILNNTEEILLMMYNHSWIHQTNQKQISVAKLLVFKIQIF